MDASGTAQSRLVLGVAIAFWTGLAVAVLAHTVFVTNDSINNYAHVWYISEHLKSAHSLPFKMPALGHGDAYAYPYGFIPWTLTAFARLVLADWAVTLSLTLGLALLVAATYWALPELRTRRLAAFVILNPFLIEGFILGQLPFFWAAAMLFASMALWRRESLVAAAMVCGAAQATHPAVIVPIAGLLALARLCCERDKTRLVAAYAGSVAIAAPAAVIVLISPALSDAGIAAALGNFVGTVAIRSMVFAVPLAAALWHDRLPPRAAVWLPVALALLLLPLLPFRRDQFAWEALLRRPDHAVEAFTESVTYEPGATYRVLRAHDGKVSMYDVLRAGGRLDSEFFPESIHRSSFTDVAAYERFLGERNVAYVVLFDSYSRTFKTNEGALLQEMVRPGGPEIVFHGKGFDVFKVGPARGAN